MGLLSTENYEVLHRKQSRDPIVDSKDERFDDESSPMSYGARQKKVENLQSAFRIPEEPLMQVAKLGRQPRTSTGSRSSRSSRSSYTQERNVSKLESLFRPVLPALSADDATASSFDPYQIKVTESAPSQLEGYKRVGIQADVAVNPNQLSLLSPSMLSIDSQGKSPAAVKVLLSEQAVHNGDFLFTDYGPQRDIRKTRSDRDSAVGSISTAAARSPLTQRSAKAVAVVSKSSSSFGPDSDYDYMKNDPIVQFPKDAQPTTVTFPAIETKMSDLSDFADLSVKDTSRETRFSTEKSIPEGEVIQSPEEGQVSWAYTNSGGKSRVTPFTKGMDTSQVTKSPFVRFQAAKEKWESQEVDDDQFAQFLKPTRSQPKDGTVSATIPEEQIQEDEIEGRMSFDSEPRWSFPSNGLNQQNQAAAIKISTSPANRFGNKSKLMAAKARPTKSPKAVKTKRKGAGGVVTARIEALDRKVIENRRLKKKLKSKQKSSNPRRFEVANTSYVRTQKLHGYAPTKVDIEKLNLIGGVKFNKIPQFDDDDISSCQSSIYMEEKKHDVKSTLNLYPHDEFAPAHTVEESEHEEDADDDTRASTAASTVLQPRRLTHPRASESSYSSSGSGLSRVKKQVFDQSRHSLMSIGDSTTMSSIIGKENQTYRPFRHAPNSVNPTKQNLMTLPANLQVQSSQPTTKGPQKWRSLAAAAQDKDNAMQGLAAWKKKHSNRNYAGYAN